MSLLIPLAMQQAVSAYAPEFININGAYGTPGDVNMFPAVGKEFTFALNAKWDGLNATSNKYLFQFIRLGSARVSVWVDSSQRLQLALYNTSGTVIYYAYTPTNYIIANTLFGFLFSINQATGDVAWLVNNTAPTLTVGTPPVDDNIGLAVDFPTHVFGAQGSGVQHWSGGIGPQWRDNRYLDPATYWNTFFGPDNHMKDLGPDGSVAGQQPGWYYRNGAGDITKRTGTPDTTANLGLYQDADEQTADTWSYSPLS